MTLGKREYTEADMIRMQRDAEERVREMHARARVAVENDNLDIPDAPPRNRNWNYGPNGRRNSSRRGNSNNNSHRAPPVSEPQRAEDTPHEGPEAPHAPEDHTHNEHHEHAQPKKTTIVEDVMGALNLDEDYLLIIGLILILVNQRADTTLILALAYLLI